MLVLPRSQALCGVWAGDKGTTQTAHFISVFTDCALWDVQGCHNISYTQMYTVIGWAGPAPAPTYLNIRNNKILNSKNHEWMGGGARHYGYSVVLGERQSIDSEITGQWT